jgi:hypothetical protein
MRGTWRRADREARGGAGTGRRSAAVGERVALGGGGGEGGAGTGRRAATGGREARIQEGRGVLGGVIAGGCIQYRECTQVYFSAAVYCIYIYVCVFSGSGLLHMKTVIHGRACASCRRPRCVHVCW